MLDGGQTVFHLLLQVHDRAYKSVAWRCQNDWRLRLILDLSWAVSHYHISTDASVTLLMTDAKDHQPSW